MNNTNKFDDVFFVGCSDTEYMDNLINNLFFNFDGVAVLNLIIDVPSKKEIIPFSEDAKLVERIFEHIDENPSSALKIMTAKAIEGPKKLGKYPHRTVPIEVDIFGHTTVEENGHIVSKVTLIVPDKSGVPFNDDIMMDVKVLYANMITMLNETFAIESDESLITVKFIGEGEYGDDSGFFYLASDRVKSDEEKKWTNYAAEQSQFVSDIYHLRNVVLYGNEGALTFFASIKPLPMDIIKAKSSYTEEEQVMIDTLFREDPKVILEMMSSYLLAYLKNKNIATQRNKAPFESRYCITREVNKETGELELVNICFVAAADKTNDPVGSKLRTNINYKVIMMALVSAYGSYYGLEGVEEKERANIINDVIFSPNNKELVVVYRDNTEEKHTIH